MKRRRRILLGILLGVPLALVLVVAFTDRGRVAGLNAIFGFEARVRRMHLETTMRSLDDWIPARSVILAGDSLMAMLPARWVDPRAVKLAVGGATAVNTASLRGRASLQRARAVVILVGTNDVAAGGVPPFEQLLGALPPHLPAIVCTIPPIDPAVHRDRSLDGIARANNHWAAAVAARPNTVLVRTETVLADGRGGLRSDLHLGDGLHLNAEGNRRLAALIREALAKIPE